VDCGARSVVLPRGKSKAGELGSLRDVRGFIRARACARARERERALPSPPAICGSRGLSGEGRDRYGRIRMLDAAARSLSLRGLSAETRNFSRAASVSPGRPQVRSNPREEENEHSHREPGDEIRGESRVGCNDAPSPTSHLPHPLPSPCRNWGKAHVAPLGSCISVRASESARNARVVRSKCRGISDF